MLMAIFSEYLLRISINEINESYYVTWLTFTVNNVKTFLSYINIFIDTDPFRHKQKKIQCFGLYENESHLGFLHCIQNLIINAS